jgi:hypothetical protein
MQTENSNSLDADTYNGTGSADFVAAKAVFAQACANCHIFHTLTEAELKAQGYFTSGDPEHSKIYYRITGSSGGQGPKNMPTNGSVSAGDRSLIKTWIQNAP